MELNIGTTSDGQRFTLNSDLLLKHGVVLGATGSGKTVMCKTLIEEAALTRVPTLAIDPKGDIGGLALAFPELDFRPWSDTEAENAGMDPDEYSRKMGERYLESLAQFDYTAEQIRQLKETTEVRIYTPKSTTGLEVSISPRMEPPPRFNELMNADPTLALDMIESTMLSLLKLVGYSDSAKKELSFLSQCLLHEWEKGSSPDLGALINQVMSPPFEEMGSLTVDQFINEKERSELASKLNLVLTLPGLKAWFVGEPLNFDRIFARGERTPITVMDLRWITEESERQFFVGMLTQELYKWLLKQGGTQNLRYLLYFDEIAGYLPSDPKNPPSKKGLRLLIKQARAFGLGCIFATQNPGDIDYMALSNINNRFVGNLKTKRDVEKVALGMDIPVTELADQLAVLKTRQFFFHNPDRGEPLFVQPRWLLTYHRGPLNPEEIQLLAAPFEKTKEEVAAAEPTKRKKAVSLPGLGESLLDPKVTTDGLLATFPLEEVMARAKRVTVRATPLLAASLSCSVEKKLPGIIEAFRADQEWQVTADMSAAGPDVLFEGVDGSEYTGSTFADGMKAIASGAEHALEKFEPAAKHRELLKAAQRTAAEELSGIIYYSPKTNMFSMDADEVRESLKDHFALDLEGKTSRVDEKQAKLEDETAYKKEKAEGDIQRYRTDIASLEGEVKDLESQKAAKKKEGKPITQLNTSISSRKRRIADIKAKISAAEKTIAMLDKKQEREAAAIAREKQLVEKQFTQTLDRELKSLELRVDPDSVAVSEPRVVWIPRTIVVDTEIGYPKGSREVTVTYTVDGAGSAGPCEHAGCTVDLTTEAPGAVCIEGGELLCEEHTLRCDVCQVALCEGHSTPCIVEGCSRAVCPEHVGERSCKICQHVVCTEHGSSCSVCGELLCPDHAINCAASGEVICKEHSWTCPQCESVLSERIDEVPCSVCQMVTCPMCSIECAAGGKPLCNEHAVACTTEGCDKHVSSEHADGHKCTYCDKVFCPDHIHDCPNCGKQVCDEHAVVLRRDLVRTEERCRNCTSDEMIAEARTRNIKLILALAFVVAFLLTLVYVRQGGF